MNKVCISSFFTAFIFACFFQAMGQTGYEASWGAGLYGVNQNCASPLSSKYGGELNFGNINMTASNTFFETNNIGDFFPGVLVANLGSVTESLPFLTNIPDKVYRSRELSDWSGLVSNQIQGPGVSWRKSEPDQIEKGIIQKGFSVWLARHETASVRGVDSGYARVFEDSLTQRQPTGSQYGDEYFELRMREWDALAFNLGITLGKGRQLLHIAAGGKLLQAGAFMDMKVYNSQLRYTDHNTVSIRADSVVYAYNPSFQQTLQSTSFIRSRYDYFENSWGYEGHVGVIYQVRNYDRKIYLEIGASVSGIGNMYYWNLNHATYEINQSNVSASQLATGLTGADGLQAMFSSLAFASKENAEGIKESLPLIATAHGKLQITSKMSLQMRAHAVRDPLAASVWQDNYRLTLCLEGRKSSLFIPVSSDRSLTPTVGILVTLGDVLVAGSNDVLSNMVASATRQGVTQSNLFIGLRIPFKGPKA